MAADEVQTLISIADGGVVSRTKHWWTLGFRISHHASLDDQLAAIRSLASTNSCAALQYIRRLAEDRIETVGPTDGPCGECNRRRWHPHARGQLSAVLSYWEGWDGSTVGHARLEDALGAIREALDRLLKSELR